ncbi:unnamed protein product [Scytosiphon promiscuus]
MNQVFNGQDMDRALYIFTVLPPQATLLFPTTRSALVACDISSACLLVSPCSCALITARLHYGGCYDGLDKTTCP